MQGWEYKIDINLDNHSLEDCQNELDKLGTEGWELVTVLDSPTESGGHNRLFFFKRPEE